MITCSLPLVMGVNVSILFWSEAHVQQRAVDAGGNR
jgi:hypothetical protein